MKKFGAKQTTLTPTSSPISFSTQVMVRTRSTEKKIPSKGPKYWEEKKKRRRITYSPNLSSSSSDTDSNQQSETCLKQEALDSSSSVGTTICCESISPLESDHHSEDDFNSKTARLECTHENNIVPLINSEDSVKNTDDTNTTPHINLKDSTVNADDTTIEGKLSVEKARHSVESTLENSAVENELKWSFNADNSSSIVSCTEERQLSSLLKKRLSQKFQSNGQLKEKSSVYCSSDSEIEKNCHNSNIETTPAESDTFVTNQSDSLHEETNKDNSNDFRVQLEPTASESDIIIKSFEIRLTRRKYEIPTPRHEIQSKESETNETAVSTSRTNEIVTTKKKNEKIVETHQDVEVLMQQIFGSSEAEIEKKIASERKLQFNDSDQGKSCKKSRLKKKLRVCASTKRSMRLDGPSDSDLESQHSEKENTRLTSGKRIKSSDSESEHKNIRRRLDMRIETSDSESEHGNTQLRPAKRIKTSDSECQRKNTRPTPAKKLETNLEKSHSSKKTDQCNRIDSKSPTGKVHKCDICKKSFPYPHVLRRHRQSMHEAPSFECSECGKKFTRKDHLKNHERIEHEQNLFRCRYCYKKFNYRHSKDKHEKSEHRNSRLFKCSLNSCRKSFACKYDFQNHKKMHERKEQKYICDECSKTFIDKLFLRKHIQRHLKSKKCTRTTEIK